MSSSSSSAAQQLSSAAAKRDESPLESLTANTIAQGAAVTKVTTIQLATESIGVAAEATASPEVITAEVAASPPEIITTAEVTAADN